MESTHKTLKEKHSPHFTKIPPLPSLLAEKIGVLNTWFFSLIAKAKQQHFNFFFFIKKLLCLLNDQVLYLLEPLNYLSHA